MTTKRKTVLRVHKPVTNRLSLIGKLYLVGKEGIFFRNLNGIVARFIKAVIPEFIFFKILFSYNMTGKAAGIDNNQFFRLCCLFFFFGRLFCFFLSLFGFCFFCFRYSLRSLRFFKSFRSAFFGLRCRFLLPIRFFRL